MEQPTPHCNPQQTIKRVFGSLGLSAVGFLPFAAVADKLLPCSAAARLPQDAKTIVMVLFPYRADDRPGTLSRYARGKDYHRVAANLLSAAAEQLCRQFAPHPFAAFCDHSPIPEVFAAAAAGLGVIGSNGLLIHPQYGSYCFIGELVTTLVIDGTARPVQSCIRCGRCIAACPGGALENGRLDCTRCASAISQKKGQLSPGEQQILLNAGSVFGCDICQEVCPLNRGRQLTHIPEFQQDLLYHLTPELCEHPPEQRAFAWRGKQVLQRNYYLLHQKSQLDNNK